MPPLCPCLAGDPLETVPQLVKDTGASLLVTDFAPLRLGRHWREGVAAKIKVPFHEVDAHNVVPVWVASGAPCRHFPSFPSAVSPVIMEVHCWRSACRCCRVLQLQACLPARC